MNSFRSQQQVKEELLSVIRVGLFHKIPIYRYLNNIRLRDALKGRKYTAQEWLALKNYCESWREYSNTLIVVLPDVWTIS